MLEGSEEQATVRSLVILSQDVHRVFGGVVPEIASRAHLTSIEPVAGPRAQRRECYREPVGRTLR